MTIIPWDAFRGPWGLHELDHPATIANSSGPPRSVTNTTIAARGAVRGTKVECSLASMSLMTARGGDYYIKGRRNVSALVTRVIVSVSVKPKPLKSSFDFVPVP